MSKDYNKKHPEIKDGEMFLYNSDIKLFHNIKWKTKRRGTQAYTMCGKPFNGYFPVFVSKEEYKKD